VEDVCRHYLTGSSASGSGKDEESQASTALDQRRALTDKLMEEVCNSINLEMAYYRVKSNKGSPGIDDLTVDELESWLLRHKTELVKSLLDGSYQPQPIRGVKIPKPDGGERQLGIPTVVDRLVQQAIQQVLTRLIDRTFSESSYGFRHGRGAHDALKKASKYVTDGRSIVVDMDLEKFFDRVNHDILMSRLSRRILDKRLLRIIRRFLEAGIMQDGVCIQREEGTPQGGPLSPFLANLLLDDLDKELEKRGHCFCRYADDCNIYVYSEEAGERVMSSVTRFLEEKLKLRVNRSKSAVARTEDRKFLGYRLMENGELGLSPKSLERAKERIKTITKRNRGISIRQMIVKLNSFIVGWVGYFQLVKSMKSQLEGLDKWTRRKLRCVKLKQLKRVKPTVAFFRSRGVSERTAWCTASSGKGWWRLSKTGASHHSMSKTWFSEENKLASLVDQYEKLKPNPEPPNT
jgi:RNA-directed DNA polymerase